jgi:hypothetical protein
MSSSKEGCGDQPAPQKQSWWQKALGYLYAKHGNGSGLGVQIKLGPFKVKAKLRNGEDTRWTTAGKVTSKVREATVAAGLAGAKVGFGRETRQVTMENDVPVEQRPTTENLLVFSLGRFEGSNAEVGVGIGGCALLCGELEVGIQGDKLLNGVRDALGNAISGVSDAAAQAISD